MPELPEVETVRRGIAPAFEGRRLTSVAVLSPKLRWDIPGDIPERLVGSIIERVGRRGKYLHLDSDRGDSLILHLGMTGKMLIRPHDPHWQRSRHDHLRFVIDRQTDVIFNDARRFGICDITRSEMLDRHKLLADMGPEPLSNHFNEVTLAAGLAGRRTPIKVALLDQKLVAGIGNIYASEALWRAGISPRRQACNVGTKRVARLVPAIRTVLEDAIASGGSTLRDYVRSDGDLGYFQHNFAVYGRDGQPCKRGSCDGTISHGVQAGRSTYFCGRCQR